MLVRERERKISVDVSEHELKVVCLYDIPVPL
jgi:hypothetical protein